jgi:hypothetical protein
MPAHYGTEDARVSRVYTIFHDHNVRLRMHGDVPRFSWHVYTMSSNVECESEPTQQWLRGCMVVSHLLDAL